MNEKCEHKHVGYDDEHYQYCLDCGKFANEWESSFSPAPTQAAGDGIELARAFYLKHSPSHGTVDIMAAFASEQTAPLLARIAELEALMEKCRDCGGTGEPLGYSDYNCSTCEGTGLTKRGREYRKRYPKQAPQPDKE